MRTLLVDEAPLDEEDEEPQHAVPVGVVACDAVQVCRTASDCLVVALRQVVVVQLLESVVSVLINLILRITCIGELVVAECIPASSDGFVFCEHETLKAPPHRREESQPGNVLLWSFLEDASQADHEATQQGDGHVENG